MNQAMRDKKEYYINNFQPSNIEYKFIGWLKAQTFNNPLVSQRIVEGYKKFSYILERIEGNKLLSHEYVTNINNFIKENKGLMLTQETLKNIFINTIERHTFITKNNHD